MSAFRVLLLTAITAYLLGGFSAVRAFVWRRESDIEKPSKLHIVLSSVVDVLKGFLVIWIAIFIYLSAFGMGCDWNYPYICNCPAWALATTLATASLFVVLGNIYPVYHRFRDNNGIAIATGVLLAFIFFSNLRYALPSFILMSALLVVRHRKFIQELFRKPKSSEEAL